MAYRHVPRATADGPPAAAELRDFLLDLGARKEFRALAPPAPGPLPPDPAAYRVPPAGPGARPAVEGLNLHGGQAFMRDFASPDTPYPRHLIKWKTGSGKTIAAIVIAQEYMRQFRSRISVPPADQPTIFVVGFTRAIIQAEMLRHPEFGYVSPAELEELRRLRQGAEAADNPDSPEARHYGGYLGVLKRRITDRSRGGYYQFYGYKEFGNRLFAVTRKGAAEGFKVQSLYARAEKTAGKAGETAGAATDATDAELAESTFIQRIEGAVAAGLVDVDEDLLGALRGGLIIADEIHNTYNIQSKNNYGVAIQYALDRLTAEDPRTAPRAVFMSATVTSGVATEVVDLLNLLVPLADLPGGRKLRREDFFRRTAEGVVPRPHAIERIGRLSAGRVSFLLPSPEDVEANYPHRIFEGEPLQDSSGAPIPYLRFIPCPMSPFHARTLAHMAGGVAGAAIATNAHTLYDMAFPNPEFAADAAAEPRGDSYGLYLSASTPIQLAAAPAAWKAKAGVAVETLRGVGEAKAGAPMVITGPFLSLNPAGAVPSVAAYSAKYHRLAQDVVEILRGGPGKIMIFHQRVRMSGVLLIQELLKMNGFVDETATPGPATLCSVCGAPRRDHGKDRGHTYAPARFVIVHSEVDRPTIERSIAKYDAASNAEGHEYRVLIGSKLIRESFDLKAIRFQLIVSMPTDIPSLMQVFGRAVRKNSHRGLPEDQRDVRVRIYVTAGGPELDRYAGKMRAYRLIQEVDRAVHIYAVDAFLNWRGEGEADLDGLPYRPAVTMADVAARPTAPYTFEAYGHGDREVATLTSALTALFRVRPVWTYDDLWATVRAPGAVGDLAVNPASFTEESFALALANLARPGDAGAAARVGEYYVWGPPGPDGKPILDVETYVRANTGLAPVRINVADYVQTARSTQNFGVRLARLEAMFEDPEVPIEDTLVDFDTEFHYALLREIVEARRGAPGSADLCRRLDAPGAPLGRMEDMYLRFRILVTNGDVAARAESRRLARADGGPKRGVAGYVSDKAVHLYDRASRPADRWYDLPKAALGIGSRYAENGTVVGYIEKKGPSQRFKIRPPVQAIVSARVRDVRSLERGAVCETRPRAEQEELAAKLKVMSRAETRDHSSAELCAAIRRRLLELEEEARAGKNGMTEGVRWFYLFPDPMPTVSLRK